MICALEEAVSKTTKAIMVVNLLGNPNNFNEIIRIIGMEESFILERQSIVEQWAPCIKENNVGLLGLMGSFSSFFLTTLPPWKEAWW